MITNEQVNLFREIYPRELNISIKKLLDAYRIKNIEELVDNEDDSQQTQQLASILSPLNESVLKDICKQINEKWEYTGGLGYDSVWNSVCLEHKLSLSSSNSWTGHPYSNKLPWHLLMKVEILGNSLKRLFVCMINLDGCSEHTAWPTKSYESASYSSLKIHNDDSNNIIPIFGKLLPKRKWNKVILEDV